jgi:PIN domain nuclease of toxin-antitoxin system
VSNTLLDASAVLCLVHRELGMAQVTPVLNEAAISTVNLAEVYGKLRDTAMSEEEIQATFADLALIVLPFEQADAYIAGQLRPLTRALGLSLGDRACLATAKRLALPVMTTDKAWQQLDIGVKIVCVR